jgi:hypothetical protein
MLDNELINRIERFVYAKPRSLQEIAQHIRKSWRTADRYVAEIEKDFGTIATRTFREGTRGALKIVYWASVEKAASTAFQEILESQLMTFRKKEEFSAFDIFQFVKDGKKDACVEEARSEDLVDLRRTADLLRQTRKQLLIFSGNLSLVNLDYKGIDLFSLLDSLVKSGVSVKVVSRVDIAGLENVERLLSLNHKYGRELVEVRHREQPLRAIVSDGKVARVKEIKEPTGKCHELNKKLFIFYTITDKEWVEWLSRLFWKMFSSSVDARRRIEEIKKLRF